MLQCTILQDGGSMKQDTGNFIALKIPKGTSFIG